MAVPISSEEKHDERSLKTRARLLDAAERLFAERGFKGASMRDITTLAEVNIAAANYHFGGKEPLFREVLRRYSTEISKRRAALGRRADEIGTIESVVEAIIMPSFEYLMENKESAIFISRLLSRIHHEIPEIAYPVFDEYFLPSLTAIEKKLHDMLPGISEPDFDWLIHSLRALFYQSISTCALASEWQKFYSTAFPPDDSARRIIRSFMALVGEFYKKTI